MSIENNPKLKIISQYFIKPKHNVKQPKSPHYLSPFDLLQLSTPYLHKGLLYAKPSSLSSINPLVDNLKESMSIALVDFYPLAGRLSTIKYEDDQSSWVYVDPGKGPGATLIHASGTEDKYKVTVNDIVTCYEKNSHFLWSFFDMGELGVVNHDGHTRPLLSVQVTDLVDGVFIGFTMNHSLGDGTSIWQFIKVLSKVFLGQGNEIEKPIFKAMFPDGYGPVLKLPYSESESITRFTVDPELRVRVFHFSAETIARLKAQVNINNNNNKNNNKKTISSFQALAAFIWLSVARVQNLPGESDMHCVFIADTRPRHDPPLPGTHFGNFVELISVTSKMDNLMKNGLCWAAMLLHQQVIGFDEKQIQTSMKELAESPRVSSSTKLRDVFGTCPIVFTGSMRFDAYGAEFGLGKAVTIRSGYSSWRNGKIVVDPGRDGGGSVDLQVCLLSEMMNALESDNEFMSYVS